MLLDAIDEVDEVGECTGEKVHLTTSFKPAILKHKETVDIHQAQRDVEIALEVWDQLGSLEEGSEINHVQSLPISCDEVVKYFRNKDMSQYMKRIKPLKQRKGLEAFKHWFAGPPKLNNILISDRNLLFAIALCPFDSSDDVHIRVLQTLYKSLSGTDKDCPRYGKHWEEVGFQGSDPGTDLRGVGFLGLLHLLYLTLNPSTANLAKEISLLSKNEKQNFPFCTMGINITRIVLESMREEVLNRECNRQMSVFDVTNDFYAGIFFKLFQVWQEQNKTIMDSGFVIKDLTSHAKKHSSVILRELFAYVKSN